MIRTLTIVAAFSLFHSASAPALAAGAANPGDGASKAEHAHGDHAEDPTAAEHGDMDHGEGGHDHGDHDADDAGDDAAADDADRLVAGIVRTDTIESALAAGGEPIVADVLGVVCDFCAKAMNKTFGRRPEVAAVYVDLDLKTLNLVTAPGATMDDDAIEALVRKAGYRTKSIRRGAAALGEDA